MYHGAHPPCHACAAPAHGQEAAPATCLPSPLHDRLLPRHRPVPPGTHAEPLCCLPERCLQNTPEEVEYVSADEGAKPRGRRPLGSTKKDELCDKFVSRAKHEMSKGINIYDIYADVCVPPSVAGPARQLGLMLRDHPAGLSTRALAESEPPCPSLALPDAHMRQAMVGSSTAGLRHCCSALPEGRVCLLRGQDLLPSSLQRGAPRLLTNIATPISVPLGLAALRRQVRPMRG
jgi:hypothetical protein